MVSLVVDIPTNTTTSTSTNDLLCIGISPEMSVVSSSSKSMIINNHNNNNNDIATTTTTTTSTTIYNNNNSNSCGEAMMVGDSPLTKYFNNSMFSPPVHSTSSFISSIKHQQQQQQQSPRINLLTPPQPPPVHIIEHVHDHDDDVDVDVNVIDDDEPNNLYRRTIALNISPENLLPVDAPTEGAACPSPYKSYMVTLGVAGSSPKQSVMVSQEQTAHDRETQGDQSPYDADDEYADDNDGDHSPTADSATQQKSSKREKQTGAWCHQCKVLKFEYIQCRAHDNGLPACNKRFCSTCMTKHYNKEVASLKQRVKPWVCPFCKQTCSCAACRRRRGELPEVGSTKPATPPLGPVKNKMVVRGTNGLKQQHEDTGVEVVGHTADKNIVVMSTGQHSIVTTPAAFYNVFPPEDAKQEFNVLTPMYRVIPEVDRSDGYKKLLRASYRGNWTERFDLTKYMERMDLDNMLFEQEILRRREEEDRIAAEVFERQQMVVENGILHQKDELTTDGAPMTSTTSTLETPKSTPLRTRRSTGDSIPLNFDMSLSALSRRKRKSPKKNAGDPETDSNGQPPAELSSDEDTSDETYLKRHAVLAAEEKVWYASFNKKKGRKKDAVHKQHSAPSSAPHSPLIKAASSQSVTSSPNLQAVKKIPLRTRLRTSYPPT
ncbi:hypothetical protein SAMD00019534_010010 [Acytostelium subglobosum LB1]|uniref:hypothetical protein n=1 Tax=Acytostelium subglobosum LB1 TaxID=1410327 RepID=UPI000644B98D|nr:hypothetical protein SAMD00019534_010010 [Acytostelium subglobosum LB1]GAM17826.1 hypothetical protein SAMD00019534_010010 [Acytostelium subglobosum LB1]|eukprot:XP_012758422.1 hypothetical protein SAMD00019534_010010 [Acytostelium subglobosum LB1]